MCLWVLVGFLMTINGNLLKKLRFTRNILRFDPFISKNMHRVPLLRNISRFLGTPFFHGTPFFWSCGGPFGLKFGPDLPFMNI